MNSSDNLEHLTAPKHTATIIAKIKNNQLDAEK